MIRILFFNLQDNWQFVNCFFFLQQTKVLTERLETGLGWNFQFSHKPVRIQTPVIPHEEDVFDFESQDWDVQLLSRIQTFFSAIWLQFIWSKL